ncbi:MAG: stage III sporulation AC/AD family protein [Clostridia bacterium]|nr:stage III sporulation AC/AD family protein [Clostridia bacterium]
MNSLSLCGIALLCYAALTILGKEKNGLTALIAIAGSLCLLLPAVLSVKGPFQELSELIKRYEFVGSQQLFKAFGIGFCCEFTAQICREAGYHGLSDALTFSCKIAILCLCIPLWQEIVSLIGGLIP